MEKIILTVMCMIHNLENNKVVVIKRSGDWPGITFPGGHVEELEPITTAVIREIKEETGLDIEDPEILTIRDWCSKKDNIRNVGVLFKTSKFKGTLTSSQEGIVWWEDFNNLTNLKLADGFELELPYFLKDIHKEMYSIIIDKKEERKYF